MIGDETNRWGVSLVGFGMSLRYGFGFALVTVVLWLIASGGSGNYLPLIGWIAVCAVGYIFSLNRHPRRNCWYCKGSGRHSGAFFGYSRRKCERCDGNGWHRRFGARLLKIEA